MKKRFKFFLLATGLLLLVIGVIAWKWQPLLKAYDTHLLNAATSSLPKCDRVELFHLDGSARPFETNGFPVRPRKCYSVILGSSTLNGADAEALAELWRAQVFGEQYQAMCHDPAYGLRFYRGSSLKFETSVCFHCSNFYITGREKPYWWGFDSKSPKAVELLNRLQQIFPASIPKPDTKRAAD